MKEFKCDIAVIGASLGGLRAAIAAAGSGKQVVLTEETDWVGGQMTSQGVPPDENWHIEKQGCTASYREYRRRVREHYRSLPNFSEELKQKETFDPGDSWVSRVSHEPQVGHAILWEELSSYISSGLVTFLPFTVPTSAEVDGDRVISVSVADTKSGDESLIIAKIFIDATEFGELLPMTGTEHRCGSDAKSDTGEPHAADVALSDDLQPVTWVFALEMVDELTEADRIPRPEIYEKYKSLVATYDDNLVFSWYCIGFDGKKRLLRMFNGEDGPKSMGLWEYRRIVGQANYTVKINEASLINWPQQDYCFGSLFGCEDAEEHRRRAKEFSLCLAYWIQNDAPRIDGGFGYPVRLEGKYLGTEDGFAKAPYVRESRRIKALHTIREQDISQEYAAGLTCYPDSVGVGFYSMDFHETLVTHTSINKKTHPYEIPLGALIPIRMKNLLPGCKNIGTTHITSAAYRLHPTEWNIGESVGYLAAFCLDEGITPAEVSGSRTKTRALQELLRSKGVQLHWNIDLL